MILNFSVLLVKRKAVIKVLDKARVKALLSELKTHMTTAIETAIVEDFTKQLEVEADIEDEVWRDIPIPQGKDYKVSADGRIVSYKSGVPKLLKPIIKSKGYLTVVMYNGTSSKIYFVHVLVALAFIPNPENKPFVNHKNGIKTDNRVENLEWVTQSENILHAFRTGLKKQARGSKSPNAKLTKDEVDYIRVHYKSGDFDFGQQALGRKFNVSSSVIYRIVHGKAYVDD